MNQSPILESIEDLKKLAREKGIDITSELSVLESKLNRTQNQANVPSGNQTWQVVQNSRDQQRPKPQHFIEALIDDFVEFHGDRYFGDDHAIMGGIGYFNGIPVTAIGTRKGQDLKSNLDFNFGMPTPEGYRKAMRLMRQAEKFNRPVLLFVDTPGAFCGLESEERGISEAIARNLFEMSNLRTPLITTITGEGGSGGALALSVSDRIYMMENAIFSVISPEGCASILFKDATKAPEAAESLKLSAANIHGLGIVDGVIPEVEDVREKPQVAFQSLKAKIDAELQVLQGLNKDQLVEQRYAKFRNMGEFDEIQMPVENLSQAADNVVNLAQTGSKSIGDKLKKTFGGLFGK